MSQITKFSIRDSGIEARIAGFMAHLRANGMRLGVEETGLALRALRSVEASRIAQTRAALRAVCTGCQTDADRFDDLFDGYWRNGGRVHSRAAGAMNTENRHSSARRGDAEETGTGEGKADTPDTDGDGSSASTGTGRLIACTTPNMARRDLREMVTPEAIAEAQAVAERLGAALRDRRSRRRRAARRGAAIDFRRVVRRALASGGAPLDLPRRTRPDRAVRIVAICDVSGSMSVYARVFLPFLAGLMRGDAKSDAFLMHTKLVPISDALREPDPMKSVARLSLLAEGFGGGSKLGGCLEQFAATHARRCVTGRSVVVILSDGYDTDPPDRLAGALATIRKRGARVIWLNPLKGWHGYAPVAAGMDAALPHCDMFAPAATLADLATLETELARL